MRQTHEERATFEEVARAFIVLVAGFLTLVSLIAFSSTGWNLASNGDVILLVRHLGGLVSPWAAVYFMGRERFTSAAVMMAVAGPFFLGIEAGEGLIRSTSGFPLVTGMPFAAAAVALLVRLVRLDAVRSARSRH